MGGGVRTSSRVDLTVRLPDGFGAAGIWWHERHEEILSVASGSIEQEKPVGLCSARPASGGECHGGTDQSWHVQSAGLVPTPGEWHPWRRLGDASTNVTAPRSEAVR